MLDPVTGIDFPFFQNQLRDMFGDPDDNGPFAQGYLRGRNELWKRINRHSHDDKGRVVITEE